MATCAGIVGAKLPDNSAEDSYNMLPVLLGKQESKPIRSFMLQQAQRLDLSIREGYWKYLDHKDSGGNNYNRRALRPYALEDTDPQAPGQLYNLETDPGETVNIYSKHPEIVNRLKTQLEKFKTTGRSAPAR